MKIKKYKNLISLKMLKHSLDKLWSQLIKMRDRRCVKCGKIDRLQSAHIFSRSQNSVRWDLENGICLCGGCHIFWAHKNPIEFSEFIRKRLGDIKFTELLQKSKTLVKVDRTLLEQKIKELQSSSVNNPEIPTSK